MRHLLISSALCFLLTLPAAQAQDLSDPGEEQGDTSSLLEEGAKLFLKGLLEEMEPAIEGLNDLGADMKPALRQMLDEMGPALLDLLSKVDDITQYHAPEILPNGDIILRRKQPQSEPDGAPEVGEDGSIEL